jgi:glycosyltransferase involved in cell wall biosynthesis
LKIVLFAHFAGAPQYGMVFGHYYLAREWVRAGHSVTIIAASYAHTRFQQPKSVEEMIDGIRYCFVRTPSYNSEGRFGRVANILTFAARTWLKSRMAADIVICSSHHPFAIYAARACAKRTGARLVFEVRDLWPLTLVELGGVRPQNPFIRAMQWAENYAYLKTDIVVSVLPGAKGYMMDHGMAAEKFIFIPNGVDIETLEPSQPLRSQDAARLDDARAGGFFLVGYAGRIGLANALHTLIDAVALTGDPSVMAVILGHGSHRPQLESQAERLGIASQIAFLDPVPKAQVGDFLARIDAAYLGLQARPIFRFGVSPTKLNDYMLAAKPVIYAVEGPGDVVAESGAGVSCGAEDPAAVADAIKSLKMKRPEELVAIGQKGLKWVRENRAYKVLALRFLEAVKAAPAAR